MLLDDKLFSCIIENTPLVSIDLIVKNDKEEVLLGLRKNEPAKGYWFIPGGRIFKDERIEEAFGRISENELGVKYNISQAKFIGVYEHFYKNSFFGEGFSTHYVVLGYEIPAGEHPIKMQTQHEKYRWFGINELLEHPKVHKYTKNYFSKEGIR